MRPSEFAEKLMALWSKPRETGDEHKAAEEYIAALSKFKSHELDKGWELLRDTYEGRSWPLVSEARNAVLAANAVKTGQAAAPAKFQEHPDFANTSMRSDMARRAKSEGWLLGLWDFANKHGRMPHSGEIGRLRESADKANHLASQLDSTNKLHRLLISIWGAMRDRERQLAALVQDQAA